MNMGIEARKAFRWNNKDSFKKLEEAGLIVKLPKEFSHITCMPDECFKCDFKEFGLVTAIYFKIRRKMNEK